MYYQTTSAKCREEGHLDECGAWDASDLKFAAAKCDAFSIGAGSARELRHKALEFMFVGVRALLTNLQGLIIWGMRCVRRSATTTDQ